MKDKLKKQFKYIGIILLMPVVLYGLICPLELFSGNQSEFLFGTKDFIWMFLIVFGLLWLIGTVIISVLPEGISNYIAAFIFSLSLSSYIQYMFLNKQLATDDGSAVDWSIYKTESIINLVIWIIVILAVMIVYVIFKEKCKKIFKYTSLFLIIIQCVAALSILFTSKYDAGLNDKYEILSDKQYMVGGQENIIVLILDKYGNLEFDQMYETHPDFAACLKDFTYYEDMNATYAYTTPVFTYIFTGVQGLEPSHYEQDRYLLDEAWSSDQSKERFNLIKEAGYERELFTLDYGHIYIDAKCFDDIFDNMGQVKLQTDSGLLFRLFVKASIYKCSPTIIKPYFETMYYSYQGVVNYLDGSPCDYYNADYYKGLTNNRLSIDEASPKKFIIEHISGGHDANIDEFANEYVTHEETEEDRENLQKGLMYLVDEYFNQLKELGVYDSSTIIVMSDHGAEYNKCDPQPIFFIKPANQHFDSIQINNAPVSSEDIMPTIMYHMGIEEYSKYGKTIYDWNESDNRTRSCGYPENDYDPMTYTGNKYELIEIMKNTPQKHILSQDRNDIEQE